VIVHEWNEHSLVKKIGEKKKKYPFKLLFHDTHHRAVTESESMKAYDLSAYDGVLAFGNMIKEIYLRKAGQRRHGPGTKLPIHASLNQYLLIITKVIWYGLATGAMKNAPKSYLNFSSIL
jgi:hypothetical protein